MASTPDASGKMVDRRLPAENSSLQARFLSPEPHTTAKKMGPILCLTTLTHGLPTWQNLRRPTFPTLRSLFSMTTSITKSPSSKIAVIRNSIEGTLFWSLFVLGLFFRPAHGTRKWYLWKLYVSPQWRRHLVRQTAPLTRGRHWRCWSLIVYSSPLRVSVSIYMESLISNVHNLLGATAPDKASKFNGGVKCDWR